MFFKKHQASAPAYIVAFLGNPGSKYAGTRHNVGFMTADAIEKSKGIRVDRLKFHALTAICELGGEKTLLMKPQTFMNLSGRAVSEAMRFYKIPLEHLIAVSDDVALPAGKLRVRRSGSAGGHNGLKSIIELCGGEGFPRIKIGVGSPENPDYDMADWVLGTFKNKEAEEIESAVNRCAGAIEELIRNGPDAAMSKYN